MMTVSMDPVTHCQALLTDKGQFGRIQGIKILVSYDNPTLRHGTANRVLACGLGRFFF